ncbi:uncharacterized protein PHACADRAFT_264829 [Phanerochaete carnosa HHB-10118-sp]|uniref:DUF6534 domain-containing protein n=1 Tax=Phanerochaete carnosa (strain HHB-10118-sp) TaxID=650164 RepID=K5VTU9_PHACS|nr:uncharacterized protein PHACADRAFT_264829 [Phanerochaete carnosa HHB-10118-sp]EKM50220.1 hypothetical protein PHACADRAFT_264829 [Phanerochaete carnosa HHB-10118-sp]
MASSFALLMGPLLVLVCLALILFGIFTAQVYYYWSTYEKDSRLVRGFVLLLWFLECLHTTFCICMLYTYFIDHFGDTGEVERIVCVSKRNFLVASVPAIALFARVGQYSCKTWTAFRQRQGPVLTLNVALSCGGLVDLVTTGLLTFYLWRSRSAFPRTQHIVDKLLHFALNTGALTMIFSMAILFTYNLVTTSLIWAGMVEIVSKLYANSMLAMLNARNNLRNAGSTNESTASAGTFRHQDVKAAHARAGLRGCASGRLQGDRQGDRL